MPTFLSDDDKPVVQFDVRLEISPFTLFRRLQQGHDLMLVDVRRRPGTLNLEGAVPLPEDWQPPADREVVLFDEDGTEAVTLGRTLQQAGHQQIRVLFGGLALYEFSLDPEVVGAETFLTRGEQEAPEP